jgi:hypothetical protein
MQGREEREGKVVTTIGFQGKEKEGCGLGPGRGRVVLQVGFWSWLLIG